MTNPPEPNSPSDADAELDDLIRGALDDGPLDGADTLRVARLESQWRAQLSRSARRRQAAWAASLAVAAAGAFVLFSVPEWDREDSPIAQLDPPPVVRVEPPGDPTREQATTPLALPEVSSAGREPTDYERWLFAAQTRTPVVAAPPERPTLERELRRVLDGEPADRLRGFDAQRVESELLAAAALPADRRRAAETLAALVGYAGWPRMVRESPDPVVRQTLTQHLLIDAGEPALLAFLRLVYDDTNRDTALAAAEELPELPIAELVALVDHREASVRLAASLALGRLNRCEMTEALIARVQERPSRSREAWFALLSCRCKTASDFLGYAARSPQLLGQLNNARIQWARILP